MASIVFDARDVLKKLKNLENGYKDMSSMFKDIVDYEVSSTALRFLDQEDPDGNKWRKPISIRRDAGGSSFSPSAAWWYWKSSNFHAVPRGWHIFGQDSRDKVLINTGQLADSISSDQNRSWGKDYAEFGTNLKYGKYVQALGFTFLGVNKKTEENIEDAYENYIKGFL